MGYAQVSRSLLAEFKTVLARDPWHVALLQEVPPRWLRPLAEGVGASGVVALTSRNLGAALRGPLADWRPDLIGAAEGGSNQLLVRPPLRIAGVRRLALRRLPERRRMLFAVIESPGGGRIAVANLHASFHTPKAATRDVEVAAGRATEWAAGLPLIFGGDLNLRPRTSPEAFAELERRHGLSGATSAGSIDHLLQHGLEPIDAPRELPAAWREAQSGDGLLIRLSDHPAVAREFRRFPTPRER